LDDFPNRYHALFHQLSPPMVLKIYEGISRLPRAGSRGTDRAIRKGGDVFAPFDDAGLDFVYVDGYAHQGNEGGETLRQWLEKVRPGGIFAGHDYHPKWKKNLAAVDAFRHANADQISQFQITAADPFPSWVVVKK
jgi:hypothetical protein